MNRRNFIKRGLLYIPTVSIFVPTVVNATSRRKMLLAKRAIAAGGGGGGACPSGLQVSYKGENDLVDSQSGLDLTDDFTNVAYGTGHIGNAFSFDGTTFIRLSAADNAAFSFGAGVAKSFAFWAYWNTSTDFQTLFFKGDYGGGNEEYFFYRNASNYAEFALYNGGTPQAITSSPDTIPDTTWTFIVIMYDGAGTATISINDGTPRNTTSLSDGDNTGGNFFMGMSAAGTRFNGLIDEFQIYNKVLTAPEIATLYAAGAGKSCPA